MTCDPASLCGQWALRRRVRDQATGLVGTVVGRLVVSARPDHLSWIETGRFDWAPPNPDAAGWAPTRSAPVTRSLRLTAVDGAWWMQFADGSPFHRWRPGAAVEHPCGADLYAGLVAISPDGRSMRTLWDVTGPSKNQRLITRLRR